MSRLSSWLSPRFFAHHGDPSPVKILAEAAQVSVADSCVSIEGYGECCFKGAVAEPYLIKQKLDKNILDSPAWAKDPVLADKVAAAVLEWAKDHGASVYCHWFQPLASSGLRHGQTGQVQSHMFEFDAAGRPVWEFKGKNILKGETDGSSYANGGLRFTHSAGGYLTVDPTSPIFLRGDCIFIPAAFVSFKGNALDEKTPLLRANDALSREGTRLLKLLGYKVKSLTPMIGLEQELFLISRESYLKRLDLQMTGRTVMGKLPPRGQQLHDHYMAPISLASPVMACMQEIQEQCFKMGIPLRTRHREVAPNQYEFASMYGSATVQIDQNLMVMQIIDEVAICYGLTALFQEKPFQGVNGSGKHNNWSIGTDDGTNLLNVAQLEKKSGNADIFPVIMAAIIKALNQYGDLMRLSVATPGNDFRLGACEAPPALFTTYLGTSMTEFLESFMNGGSDNYNPKSTLIDMGASVLPQIEIPSEDRNRTSPFPYGGHRFEFRAVGSSQNASLVNTVLATICAKTFKEFADSIESGANARQLAQDTLKANWNVVFNGDGYDPANQAMLTERGCWRIDSGVDAICKFTEEKNIAVFDEMGVLKPEECAARQALLLEHYAGTVEMECGCMIDMIVQHVIPSCHQSNIPNCIALVSGLEKSVAALKEALHKVHSETDGVVKAKLARELRLDTMLSIRSKCDEAEAIVPSALWTIGTYKELLFVDQHYRRS